MPPPLPPEVLQTILTHLLPPTPPLPPDLVSRSLLERLTYLPPDPDDIDSQISPRPVPGLSERLAEIARDCHPSSVDYSHDGEVVIGRCIIQSTDVGEQLEVIFEYEQGDDGRGWVYRSTNDVSPTGDWMNDVDKVVIEERDVDIKPDEYWTGFTPPTPRLEIQGQDTAEADDYWAQYDQAVTPANQSVVPSRRQSGIGLTPGPSANGHNKALEILGALSLSSSPPTTIESVSPSERLLRDKLSAIISSILRRTWTDFIKGAEQNQGEMEQKALEWIQMGRDVVEEAAAEGALSDTVYAKLQVLKEMHGVLIGGGKAAEDGFWTLIQEAIRLPLRSNGEDRTQIVYWE
ncbi:hypothetical protein BCR39DRAFT_551268 [Naematelia encephala]|uniref:Uncharacterized protein n=1 Tax=Naematelia encephala TaxID=71784 RepID=A0A1Y2AJ94_9TREE|nr:hypothetical protein BCR39DRAFT_551268 [Naematelia encephala]